MLGPLADVMDAAAGTLRHLPLDMFLLKFMRRAAVSMFLLAPLCATLGTQVVNFRLSFFADAVSHSAFTGLAIGMLALSAAGQGIDAAPWFMAPFGVLVACLITWQRRRSSLSSDTVVGVYSTVTYAAGLWLLIWLVNRGVPRAGQAFNSFLFGSVVTVDKNDLAALFLLAVVAVAFLAWSYNRLVLVGLNVDLARTTGVGAAGYEYGFAALLACVVMACVPIVGALVVTALLVVPAAAARNFARSAGGVFWWGLAISWTSALGGLYLADKYNAAAGASIVLCAAAWFFVGQLWSLRRR